MPETANPHDYVVSVNLDASVASEQEALTQITALCDLGEALVEEVKKLLQLNGAHFEGTP